MYRHCPDRCGCLAAAVLLLLAGCAGVPGVTDRQAPAAAATSGLPGDYARARDLMEAGHYAQAVPVLEALARAHPQHANPHINLALALRALQQPEDAMAAVQRALAIRPDSAEALHQLAILERERGDFTAAATAYERCLLQQPDYALAHLNLGILLDLYLQQPVQALDHYRRYQELGAEPDATVAGWIRDLERRSVARAPGGN